MTDRQEVYSTHIFTILQPASVDPAATQKGDMSAALADAAKEEEELEKNFEEQEKWDDWDAEEEEPEERNEPERRATHPLIDSIVHRRKRKKSSVNAGVQESVYATCSAGREALRFVYGLLGNAVLSFFMLFFLP